MPTFAGLHLLDEIRRRAADAGLNVLGVVACDEFDRCQPRGRRAREILPECETILVLGSGGSEFWEKMTQEEGSPGRPKADHHPINRRGARLTGELMVWLRDHGMRSAAVYPDANRTLNFVQLAEVAGMGYVSPVIGQLLHPTYGPWVSLRSAILIAGKPFGDARRLPKAVGEQFEPCLTCSRPCMRACPISVYEVGDYPDFERCTEHRVQGNCERGCDVRRACPIGAEHRYGPQEEAFRHAYSLFQMRRAYGHGFWRLVPKRLR